MFALIAEMVELALPKTIQGLRLWLMHPCLQTSGGEGMKGGPSPHQCASKMNE